MPLVDTLTVAAGPAAAPSSRAAAASCCAPTSSPPATSPPPSPSWSRASTAGERNQVLLGATGTGKTFTAAKIIEATQRPAIILAPNKTLAAQLYGEFKGFFPENAVEYFVSYYDYYQPEAYVAAHRHLHREGKPDQRADRPDAPLGHPRAARTRRRHHRRLGLLHLRHRLGRDLRRHDPGPRRRPGLRPAPGHRRPRRAAVPPQRRRPSQRGTFRVRGDSLELWPAHLEDRAWRLSFFGEELESIHEFDPLTGARTDDARPRSASTPTRTTSRRARRCSRRSRASRPSSASRLDQLVAEGKLLEAQRLEQRTNFDLEMLEATGSCAGIENYSRYLTGRKPGEPPPTLFEYIPDNAIVFADESHVSRPADRRHVPRRLPPQVHPRRARLPPALLHGQPPAQVRGVGRHAPAVGLRLGHPRRLGARPDRRRLHRAGDPPHRPDRPAGRDPPGLDAGRRPPRRGPQGRRRRATARWSPR